MEIDKIIDELIEDKILNFENLKYIRVSKLRSMIFSKYNIEFKLAEVKECLVKIDTIIEIANNLFVLKTELEKLLKDSPSESYKSILEKEYVVQIEDKYLLNIDIGPRKKSYREILDYGLKNAYIKHEWLANMDLKGSGLYEVCEAVSELTKAGIKIK
ncbi:MAG: hypothetical protein ACRDAQ_11040 [Cetobacterium sp.]